MLWREDRQWEREEEKYVSVDGGWWLRTTVAGMKTDCCRCLLGKKTPILKTSSEYKKTKSRNFKEIKPIKS